jgi:hypothetical protein
MVTRAADDYAEIHKRLEERRRERIVREVAGAACECPDDEREDGTTVRSHRIGCRHYVATSHRPSLAPLQQQRASWDGRRTVMRQAQSPEAAFLQRLHLRIERARPRSFWAPK